jgi:hypothetical protein fulcA4_15220
MQIFIIGGIIAIMIAITIFNIIFLKKGQEADKKFREENPDISTIKFHASSHIVSSATTVYTVDEKIPQYSKASFKGYIFIEEGEHILSVGASFTRPGIMYKTVTTNVGPTDIKVKIEKRKDYILKYDKKEGFFLEEITKK